MNDEKFPPGRKANEKREKRKRIKRRKRKRKRKENVQLKQAPKYPFQRQH